MSLGVPELLIVFAIVVVLFGASRLPGLGKGLGEGFTNLKKGLRGAGELPAGDEDGDEDDRH